MKCPSCENGKLQNAYLENDLPCKTCDHCGGNWLLLEHYLRWKGGHTEEITLSESDVKVELTETERALICPASGALMLKYRISKDSEHRLDLSPNINGVWLDRGEWQLLKRSGLAEKLNKIFTAPWQKEISAGSSKDMFEQLYRQKFGNADYERAQEIRDWLQDHPNRYALRAFLISDNPWSAK